ncbi:MAG: nucleotidyltransferase domain-containing protein [Candidatus Poribacteria bacterium]
MKLLEDIELQDILNDLTEQVISISGDILLRIMLFGSYADGKASSESDIDLLLVLEYDDSNIVESIRDAIYDLMWKNDFEFIISSHFITEDHYNLIKKANTTFYQELIKKGKILWENSKKRQSVG